MTLISLYVINISQGFSKGTSYVMARDEIIFSTMITLTYETKSYKTMNELRRQDIAADIADGLSPYQMLGNN